MTIKMTEAEKKQRNKSLSVLKVYNITIAATLRGDLFYADIIISLYQCDEKIMFKLKRSAHRYRTECV